jgi:hypothetical protein
MKRFALAAAMAVFSTGIAAAQTNPFQAFVGAVNSGSVEGCMNIFAEGAPFMDIGKDLTALDRKQWFCDAVVSAKSTYTILSETRDGDVITFTVDYRAGGYFLEAKGTATVAGDKIAAMTIEAR